MSFISIEFAFFCVIVFATYYIVSKRYRYIVLAIASYIFYAVCDFKYIFLLFAITVVTYIGAQLARTKYRKISYFFTLGCVVGVLLFFKVGIWGSCRLNLILPIGLSFYTLQALGYLMDVYNGKSTVEKNFLKYSLFVSFFLTIVSGPIERSGNLLKQIQEGTDFSYDRAKKGILRIIYGCFQKALIADRIGILTNEAFSNFEGYTGAALMWAVVLYGIQIYADFSGYSNIVIGIGNLLGFDLIDNFKQPYFSKGIKEFWSRWHISLSSWLKEYIYIPLGGNRCGKLRMYSNLIITFLISGIWHGTGWNYIIWGGLHGVYQVIGKATLQYRSKLKEKLGINYNCFSFRWGQGLITFTLVDFAWLFFGASSTSTAIKILKEIIMNFQFGNTLSKESYLFGMSEKRYIILIMEIISVMLIDVLHEKNISIKIFLEEQNILFRWIIYIIIVLVVLIGIIYNYGIETSNFIYTRF